MQASTHPAGDAAMQAAVETASSKLAGIPSTCMALRIMGNGVIHCINTGMEFQCPPRLGSPVISQTPVPTSFIELMAKKFLRRCRMGVS